MPRKRAPSKDDKREPSDGQKRTIITLSVSSDDVERLQQAFAAGKLAELGVIDLTVLPSNSTSKTWGESEKKRRLRPDPGSPALPE
jgi:hypothetical protein